MGVSVPGRAATLSSAPDFHAILIVDQLPLRTFGLVAALNRFTGAGKLHVASLTVEGAKRWVDAGTPCSMIIYNMAGASLTERRHARQLKMLRAHAADTPLVVVSDSDNQDEAISAFRVGAQGFLFSGASAKRARQAIFPNFAAAKAPRPRRRVEAMRAPVEAPASNAEDGRAHATNAIDIGGDNGLTNRERAVFRWLGKGESNKAIARRLDIREGTVKVHVRQIMLKFGAANRTQIAIASANNGGH